MDSFQFIQHHPNPSYQSLHPFTTPQCNYVLHTFSFCVSFVSISRRLHPTLYSTNSSHLFSEDTSIVNIRTSPRSKLQIYSYYSQKRVVHQVLQVLYPRSLFLLFELLLPHSFILPGENISRCHVRLVVEVSFDVKTHISG